METMCHWAWRNKKQENEKQPDVKSAIPFQHAGVIVILLGELLSGIEILETNVTDFSCEIAHIGYDSEDRFDGGIFVALRGNVSDGNTYIPRAVYHGARYIITERSVGLLEDIGYFRVKSARRALSYLYSNLYRRPQDSMKLIAVTGTNGKTTTTYMLQAILREAGYRTALIGTVNSALTTPDPDQLYRRLRSEADAGSEYVVMEASSHALSYEKLAPIHYRAAIFTNLTPEHLDFHRTMEAYMEAKLKLFTQCRSAFFNFDDPYGQQMCYRADCEKFFYSAQSDAADYTARNVELHGIDGVSYHLHAPSVILRIGSPMPGIFNVYNTLAAAACTHHLGIGVRTIRQALEKMRGVPGRIERLPLQSDAFAVFIDYAHTPDALENMLRTMRRFLRSDQRLVLLFGCGGDRDRSKRPVMGTIASRFADEVIVTSDNSRSEDPEAIIAEILCGIDRNTNCRVIVDRREAIETAVLEARPGDVILLAGKGHEDYEITAQGKHPFSERQIVLEAESRRRSH